ncbi:lipocalin family protein [Aquimarina sp. 2201CG1-2-11]|uniref:lipocalin family protein n=1 Tax=Aquimarina discodermiae TaxID=3231043 RepID=UPI0034631482
MKRTFTFITSVILLFFSCKKDDDNTPETLPITEDNLIGKWELKSQEEDGVFFEIEKCDDKYIMTLSTNQNNTYLAKFTEYIEEEGQCDPTTSIDYNWELENETFTTYITNEILGDIKLEADSFTIIELTASSLKIKSEETFTNLEGNQQTEVSIDTYTKI